MLPPSVADSHTISDYKYMPHEYNSICLSLINGGNALLNKVGVGVGVGVRLGIGLLEHK